MRGIHTEQYILSARLMSRIIFASVLHGRDSGISGNPLHQNVTNTESDTCKLGQLRHVDRVAKDPIWHTLHPLQILTNTEKTECNVFREERVWRAPWKRTESFGDFDSFLSLPLMFELPCRCSCPSFPYLTPYCPTTIIKWKPFHNVEAYEKPDLRANVIHDTFVKPKRNKGKNPSSLIEKLIRSSNRSYLCIVIEYSADYINM